MTLQGDGFLGAVAIQFNTYRISAARDGRAGASTAPLRSGSPPVFLRKLAAALAARSYVASTGRPYEAAAVALTGKMHPRPSKGHCEVSPLLLLWFERSVA
jgi:hypothetical protein